jgi:DNA-binding NarL/FixJ family response regulator
MNGADATRAVLAACPTTRVVCLSASVTDREMAEVRAAGAVACVTKDEDFDSIVATVREAAA